MDKTAIPEARMTSIIMYVWYYEKGIISETYPLEGAGSKRMGFDSTCQVGWNLRFVPTRRGTYDVKWSVRAN